MGRLHNAITVPLTAVVHGPDRLFVYTVRPNDTVQQQPITVGYQDGATAVVTNGVESGAEIVVAGQARLAPGVRVASQNATSSGPSEPGQGGGSTASG